MTEEDEGYRKNGCGDVDKDWKKTKQTFKRSITRSARPNHVVALKASTVIPTDMPTPSNISSENRDVQSLRQIRSNYGTCRHISQASKRTNKENKKVRKRNVIGSLASILGPEEESGRWELPLESDNGFHSPSGTKSINIAAAANDHDHDCDYGKELSPGRKRRTSLASKQTEKKKKKNRRNNVMGSLTSVLGPEKRSLAASDDNVLLASGMKSPCTTVAAAEYKSPLKTRKRQTSHRISPAPKSGNKNKNDRKQKISGSLVSILGPEEESSVTPDHGTFLASRTESSDTAVAAATSSVSSPTTRKLRTAKHGFVSIPIRPNAEKHEQQNRDKFKSVQPAKKFQFNETKVREQIRAKLRKNQQKYDTLAAALVSAKDKTTSNPTNLIASEATSSLKASRAVVARTHGNNIRPTSQEPKLRSRAKNGRLYSVSLRIPLSIPEDSVLEIDKPKKLKNSASKAKASFRPRSPRNFPKSSATRARRQPRFSVLSPHPVECGGSSRGNYGGLCMTFPTKNDGGGKLEETVQTTIRHQRNKQLSFKKWVANQKQIQKPMNDQQRRILSRLPY